MYIVQNAANGSLYKLLFCFLGNFQLKSEQYVYKTKNCRTLFLLSKKLWGRN